ncbi:hypothetical protein GCM10009555_062580 [Acrocarpospora macrocephala]|uniref:Collagen-like protein n=1 Tax=Acrocarpospora macrocephala TaxID=150177 RepID=A0A5M3WFH0_9ACTN|nr:hypothetical protein Amac_014020 [Acrocarpospora macrocephala]
MAGGAGVAVAVAEARNGEIVACVGLDGVLRIPSGLGETALATSRPVPTPTTFPTGRCPDGYRELSWNETGPVGPVGPTGATGEPGPAGSQGETGPAGERDPRGSAVRPDLRALPESVDPPGRRARLGPRASRDWSGSPTSGPSRRGTAVAVPRPARLASSW